MRRIRITLALIVALLLTVVPPMPAQADFALLTLTGNPLTSPAAPYLVLTGLSGQSACALTINTAGGSMGVEGLYKGTSTWTPALVTVSPDGTTSQSVETAAGSYVFNCAAMVAIRVDGTSASGTPSVTLNAGGGINRVLGAGVNGGRTNVVGYGQIVVTNAGNTATISCTGCGPGPSPTPVSVQAGTGIAVATPSPGVFVISSTVTPAPTATPVSVQAGSNVTVATPAPGVFVVSAATAPPPNITSSNTNLTVATPSANTYVLTVVTPSPAPTQTPVSVVAGSTNVMVATPSPGVFSVSVTPPVITAGTGIAVATPSSNSYTISSTNTATVSNITSANNLLTVGSPTGPSVTLTPNEAPMYTGQVQAADSFVNPGNTTGSIAVGLRLGSSVGSAHQSIWLACPSGYAIECSTAGVYGYLWDAIDGGNGIAEMSLDASGDLGVAGYFASSTLTSGRCLQATTSGQIANAPAGCITTYLNGTQQTSATQAPHIEQYNSGPTVANGATRTYTFAVAYITAPVCQVQQSVAGVSPALGGSQGIYPSTITTTTVTISNNSGATQTPYVSCIGL